MTSRRSSPRRVAADHRAGKTEAEPAGAEKMHQIRDEARAEADDTRRNIDAVRAEVERARVAAEQARASGERAREAAELARQKAARAQDDQRTTARRRPPER